MNRLRSLVALALGTLFLPLASQEVNRPEIESVKNRKIEFISYEGPHAVVDSKADIYGIGEGLGSPVAGGARTAGSLDRYGVIHAVDPALKTGFDADIIVLGRDAGVDHIRNLRWIISGFLQKAYGYSLRDADVLAEFITIYNAVYRGDLDYFSSRYKPVVMGHLSRENAGLALRWDEWRGRTRIVIPLGSGAGVGKISSVDTGALTEEKVVDKLRDAEDKGVDTRKGMVDIKEREIEETEKDIAEDKETLAEEEKALAEEKEAIAEEEKAIAEEKERIAEEEKAGIVDHAEDKEAIAAREKELEERKEASAQAEKEQAELAETIRREEAARDAKEAEVKEDRATIAKDQQDAITEEITGKPGEDAAGAPSGTFPQALGAASSLSRLVSLNLATGGTLKQSEINTIHGRTLLDSEGTYYCVAGGMVAAQAVRLVSLDKESLKMKAEGKDDLFEDSLLVLKDGTLYAIVARGGSFFLGSFDKNLSLKAISGESVHPYTALEFREEGILVQRDKGGFAFLDPAGLKARKILK